MLPETTPDGRPIVKNFGARAFVPGAVPTLDQEKAFWRGKGRAMSGARVLTEITLLDVGCCIWSTERRVGPGVDDDPIGGVIVQITQRVDEETGEVLPTYVTVDPYRTRPKLQWRRLEVTEINRESMELPSEGHVRSLARRLAEEIGKSTGPFTPQLIDFDHWQHTLVSLLAGQR